MNRKKKAEWRKRERKSGRREQGNVIFSLTLGAFVSLGADARPNGC